MKKILLMLMLFVTNSYAYVNVPKIDCAKWIEARETKRSSLFENFVYGFVSGSSMTSGVEVWERGGNQIRPEQLYLWMDKFCRNNPVDVVTHGSVVFINEISNGQYNKKVEGKK
jgi:hypothetical protein